MASIFLAFGKFKGKALAEIPTNYLRWLTGCNNLDRYLAGQVQAELKDRGERYLSAAEVLEDIEDEVAARLSDADNIDDDVAGQLGDLLLVAFDSIRRRHRIGRESELVVPAEVTCQRNNAWDQKP
jgi:hypothetical protein